MAAGSAQTRPQMAAAANAAPRVGPVVINEIMYNPLPGKSEYVELRGSHFVHLEQPDRVGPRGAQGSLER